MNVTACDLENSFTFDNKALITSYVRFLIYVTMCKQSVVESCFIYEL